MSFVSGGALLCVVHLVFGQWLWFAGAEHCVWALGCCLWALGCHLWVPDCHLWAFTGGICHPRVGANVRGHGCLVVVSGHIGAVACVVSCVVWSSLVRMDGTKVNGYLASNYNNK